MFRSLKSIKHTHTPKPAIHFKQSDIFCYCLELLCFSVFLEIFSGLNSLFHSHLCNKYQKNLWKFSSFLWWPWTRWKYANKANMKWKRWRQWRQRRRYITFMPFRLICSTVKLNFPTIGVCACTFEHRRNNNILCYAERQSFSSSQALFYSILFFSIQFISLSHSFSLFHCLSVLLFFIVSLIGCLYLCGRREIQIW